MTKHGVGGAAHRLATGGVGSSPAVSISETRVKSLRHMLRVRDRRLCVYDDPLRRRYMLASDLKKCRIWDAERRAIREKIKAMAVAR